MLVFPLRVMVRVMLTVRMVVRMMVMVRMVVRMGTIMVVRMEPIPAFLPTQFALVIKFGLAIASCP